MRFDVQETITQLGLEYRLMTQFTSFVAVEEITITDGGKPRRVEVPIETPEGSFGGDVEVDDESFSSGSLNYKPSPKQISTRRELIATRNVPPVRKSVATVVSSSNASVVPSSPSGPALSPTPVPKVISSGVLNGKAISLPKPAYPPAAKSAKVSGAVIVQVTIDESGNVISATAISGHPLLRASATNAAGQSRFAPTLLSGQPVKVTGTIVYNFDSSGNATMTASTETKDEPIPSSPEEEKQRELLTKLHPAIAALVIGLKDKRIGGGPEQVNFVSDGKAELQVWLKEKTPEAMTELKGLGFEIIFDLQTSKLVIGRIATEKLIELIELKSIRYVAPMAKAK